MTSWWREAVIYEVYLRSFKDSDGDGVGDLEGVRRGLDYLQGLGVDALWITPFFRTPGRDLGYDIADHTDVDPLFGSLTTFDRLLEDAHSRGLRILIDFVPNHTSDQHPWFVESRSSVSSPRRDWYVWAEPAEGGGPPNNWLSVFGGDAWTLDERTGQFYMHSFLPEMPDLNWRQPEVEDAMADVVRFWLDRGVDGLRIDCAHYVMKDPELRDNPPALPGALAFHRPMGDYDTQVHLHDKGHPDVHDVYRRLRRLLDGYGSGSAERVSIGEVHVFDFVEWASYYGTELDELHMPFNFGLLEAHWRPESIAELIRVLDRAIPRGAWPSWLVGNHDEPRVASRVGPEQSRVAMMLLLTLRGTPTLFQGDELGLPDGDPLDDPRDPWAAADPALSRDRARAPLPWTPGQHRGFTTRPAGPWLPPYQRPGLDVESQTASPGSMLELTRALLSIRRANRALRLGALELLTDLPADVLGYLRCDDEQTLLVLLNFGAQGHTSALPALAVPILSTHVNSGGVTADRYALAPHEGVIFALPSHGVCDCHLTTRL